MKTPISLLLGGVVLALAGLWTVAGEAAPPKSRGAGAKPELYTVVQVGEEVQVIKKSELMDLRKTIADEDKQKKKEYDDAKKAAAKSKEKIDLGKPPAKRSVKVLRDSFKSDEEANAWMQKHPPKKKSSQL